MRCRRAASTARAWSARWKRSGSFVGPSGGNGTGDYGFSQIVVVPAGNVVPVPESRTAAAILCALFVAGLVGRQLLLRRQEDAAVSAVLAA